MNISLKQFFILGRKYAEQKLNRIIDQNIGLIEVKLYHLFFENSKFVRPDSRNQFPLPLPPSSFLANSKCENSSQDHRRRYRLRLIGLKQLYVQVLFYLSP